MDAGEWARQFAAKRRRTAGPPASAAAAAAGAPQPPPRLAPPTLVPLHTVCTPPPGSAAAAPVGSGAAPAAAGASSAPGTDAAALDDGEEGDGSAGDDAVVDDPAAALPVALPGGVAARARAVNARVERELAAVARAVAARQQRAAGGGSAPLPSAPAMQPQPPQEYRFFDRQADAYAHADALTLTWPDPAAAPFKVFSVEMGGRDGKRRFIVAHVAAFWRAYAAAGRAWRHAYELLREDTPVHLYYDVEFKREPVPVPVAAVPGAAGEGGDDGAVAVASPPTRTTNADVDGDALVALLLQRTAAALHADYGLPPPTAADVVHLESSTPAKFSRHLVVRLPLPAEPGEQDEVDGGGGTSDTAASAVPPLLHRQRRQRHAMFRDTAHAGAFVGRLVAALQAERGANPAVDALWVETTKGTAGGTHFAPTSSVTTVAPVAGDADGATATAPPPPPPSLPREFVADLGVYTRNRAMRMYLSSKRGKGVPLMPAAANAHLVPPPPAAGAADSGGSGAAAANVGDPLTLDYWLRACGRPAFPLPKQRQQQDTEPPTSSPLVQVGSAEWERALWEASLITGTLPPLWMCRRLAGGDDGSGGGSSDGDSRSASATTIGSPPPPPAMPARQPLDAQIASLAAEYERSRQHAAYRPAVHPLTGDRLLYALAPPPPQQQRQQALAGQDDGAVVGALARAASTAPTVNGSSRPGEPQTRLVVGGSSPPPFPALAAWVCQLASGPVPPSAFEQSGSAAAATAAAVPSNPLLPIGRPGSAADAEAAALTRPAQARIRGWNAQAVDLLVQLPPAHSAAAPSGTGDGTPPARAVAVLTSVTYEIGGSRWCNRVGRQHRSNHVAWRVDLPRGCAWQTCWDVDCRAARYRSPAVAVPPEVLPSQLPPGAVVLPQSSASSVPPAPAPAPPSEAGTAAAAGTTIASTAWDALLTDEELLALDL